MFELATTGPADRRQAEPRSTGFLVPSVFGHEPFLSDLCRAVGEGVDLHVLTLPDTHSRGRLLTDMVATGRDLTDQVFDRQPTGPIVLVGYSFGASLALEVAGQLERLGREISFLGILDGPFEPPEMPKPRATAPGASAMRRLLRPVAVALVENSRLLRRWSWFGLGRRSLKAERAEEMRRAILWHLRSKALRSWTPRGCAAPGLHVTTGDYGSANRVRWAELCPNLRHAEVPVLHEDLLKRRSLAAVSSLLKAAIRDTRRAPATAAPSTPVPARPRRSSLDRRGSSGPARMRRP